MALRGRGLSAVYIGLPVALVQAWTSSAVPAFAAVERLMRMGLLVLQSIPNRFQRAVGLASRDPAAMRAVSKHVLLLQSGVGVIGSLSCALAMPFAVDLTFAGKVTVGSAAAWIAGIIVPLTCLSRATGMILVARRPSPVARRQVVWVTVSAGTAACMAVGLIAVLAREFGAAGALGALAIAESAALAVQTCAVLRSQP